VPNKDAPTNRHESCQLKEETMKVRFTVPSLATVAAALALPATALGSTEVPNQVAAPNEVVAPSQFGYTGSQQSYVVPSGVMLEGVYVQGAWGGAYGGINQAGATVRALLPVTPGERLYVEVGQNGSYGGKATFGGGGAAGSPPPVVSGAGGEYASSGGGASDIRTCSALAKTCAGSGTSLGSRLVVAGGGGGFGGGGNGEVPCTNQQAGSADNGQPLPKGDPLVGPVPIITAAGTVVPGLASNNHPKVETNNGVTDAAPGSDAPGTGGSMTGCAGGSSGANALSDSVPGGTGSGPAGGTGGDASGLPPFSGDGCTGNECADAGPGGGGGGGYYGGGGGATGLDHCVSPNGACNSATYGQGGAGGSSFVSKKVLYPSLGGAAATGKVFVRFAPAVEIDAPANGAVYSPGQVVYARWSCQLVDPIVGTLAQNCAGTVAPGSLISTTAGKHTFTVKGERQDPQEPIRVTVTYTVGPS
jgi:hypothetical protein